MLTEQAKANDMHPSQNTPQAKKKRAAYEKAERDLKNKAEVVDSLTDEYNTAKDSGDDTKAGAIKLKLDKAVKEHENAREKVESFTR